jgi:Arc/MetJ-type ribon-helix-helix transcriptional regulator
MAKVMISLPEELLRLLDEAATREEKSRSAFIREAVRERLARGSLDTRREALEYLRRSFRDAPDIKPEEFIRAERDRRYGPP